MFSTSLAIVTTSWGVLIISNPATLAMCILVIAVAMRFRPRN